MADPQEDDEDGMDYLFKRMTPDNLARAIIGDVRITPTPEQLEHAQAIMNHTHLRDWAHKAGG